MPNDNRYHMPIIITLGTCIFTKFFVNNYWLKKIQFTHVLSFWALGQVSHMKYSILCCKDIIHRFLRFVNANAKNLFFHFFHEFSLFSVKIHSLCENSLLGWKFSRAVWKFDFVKMHNFRLGYLSHWYKKRRKWKMQEKIWVFYWQNAVFDI